MTCRKLIEERMGTTPGLLLMLAMISMIAASVITQIGSDVGNSSSTFGRSLSLSEDGTTLAVNAYLHDGPNGVNSGLVQVYRNKDDTWEQIGSDINGPEAYAKMRSVSLSADGKRVAIGGTKKSGERKQRIQVYQEENGDWIQLGEDIISDTYVDRGGAAMDLSDDGMVVAVGSLWEEDKELHGYVRIHQYENGKWNQLGSDIVADALNYYYGWSVSISSNGKLVTVGTIEYIGMDFPATNHVVIYEYDDGRWKQKGLIIKGATVNDFIRQRVSVSSDGQTVGIHEYGRNKSENVFAYTHVYQYTNGNWDQIGNSIEAEYGDDKPFDGSLSLSHNGRILALGKSSFDGNGTVQIYQNENGYWSQIGTDIVEKRGAYSVSLSADGTIIATGTSSDGNNDEVFGHAKVFQIVCDSNADCKNNGACDQHNGVCTCSDEWELPFCAYMDDSSAQAVQPLTVYLLLIGISGSFNV